MRETEVNPPDVDVSRFKLPWRRRWSNFYRGIMPRRNRPLSVESILAKAGEKAALGDWWDERLEGALERLVETFNRESQAGPEGQGLLFQQCVKAVVTRGRIEADLKDHPEILEKPVERPIFITGMPRTGTTLLQKLLAQDPNRRALLYWELIWPAPAPDPDHRLDDPRIASVEASLEKLYRIAPQIKALHRLEATEPEECLGLFDLEFANLSKCAAFNMPSYHSWLLSRDMKVVYGFYKQTLQYLAWKFPPRRWVLKAPMHLNFLDALLSVFPDAHIVQTHRDPTQTLPSTASLVYLIRMVSLGRANPRELGAHTLARQAEAVSRAIKTRATADPARFLDVSYRALKDDPVAMARRIYEHFDIEYSDAFEDRMKAWLRDNRQHKHGRHRYNLAQFGLEKDRIRQAFTEYLDTYRAYL